jgi:hypothetical protein
MRREREDVDEEGGLTREASHETPDLVGDLVHVSHRRRVNQPVLRGEKGRERER